MATCVQAANQIYWIQNGYLCTGRQPNLLNPIWLLACQLLNSKLLLWMRATNKFTEFHVATKMQTTPKLLHPKLLILCRAPNKFFWFQHGYLCAGRQPNILNPKWLLVYGPPTKFTESNMATCMPVAEFEIAALNAGHQQIYWIPCCY